jgi:hypothetical protein
MLNGHELLREWNTPYKISYHRGEVLVRFIDFLIKTLPEESRDYGTSKEAYIRTEIMNILEIGNEFK